MKLLGRRAVPPPSETVADWGAVTGARVVSICHPHWRGVRTSAYSHRLPVIEVENAAEWAQHLVTRLGEGGVEVMVVHGFPPGSDRLIREASRAGLSTRLVLYSSMAQHGADLIEAEVADAAVVLLREGSLGKLGFAKEGEAETLAALGIDASFVPNRAPDLPEVRRQDLGEGLHIGVFAESFWRKNVVTQLGAVALMDGATAHAISKPSLAYLEGLHVEEHGLLPYQDFISLQASVDLNLYVTLSECFPLTPVESYLCGVPCLSSRTSAVFRDDPKLWELTTTDQPDDPVAIAAGARRLLRQRDEAVEQARIWIERWDQIAAQRWTEFIGS